MVFFTSAKGYSSFYLKPARADEPPAAYEITQEIGHKSHKSRQYLWNHNGHQDERERRLLLLPVAGQERY